MAMRETVRFPSDDCLPTAADVLAGQGVPADRPTAEPVAESLREALELFRKLAAPVGILSDITTAEFTTVYRGEGRNASESPLAAIFPRAERLALFAVTIGERVGDEISRLFASGRFDLGYLLDAAASSGTDRLAENVQQLLAPRAPAGTVFLRYSPGYCGWDITGQRELFRALRPEEIGITLRESCLMEPLKSISGVLVAARPEVHRFDNNYPFCRVCTMRTCRSRMAGIRNIKPPNHETGRNESRQASDP
jgi:hypothetical protein